MITCQYSVIFVQLRKKKNTVNDAPVTYRSFNINALSTFCASIESIDLDIVYSEQKPNIFYDIFLQHVKSCYDAAFPLHYYKKHVKSRKPWINRGLYSQNEINYTTTSLE